VAQRRTAGIVLALRPDDLVDLLFHQLGEHAEAEGLARQAVSICEETDMLNVQGNVFADLAEVLSLAGRPKEATEALEQALARYERKGNLVMAQRAQMRLAELQDAAPR
jgi:tetratricopeptide (TPR) repeat protein